METHEIWSVFKTAYIFIFLYWFILFIKFILFHFFFIFFFAVQVWVSYFDYHQSKNFPYHLEMRFSAARWSEKKTKKNKERYRFLD